MRIIAPTGKRVIVPAGMRSYARDMRGVLSNRTNLEMAIPLRHHAMAVWSEGKYRLQAPNTPAVDVDGSYLPWQGGFKQAVLNEPRFGGFNEATRGNGVIIEATEVNASPDFDSAWTVRGTVTRTGGQVDPFGGMNAFLFEGFGPTTNDTYNSNIISGLADDLALSVGVMLHPNGQTGTLRIQNAQKSSQGNWDVDLSALSQAWHWITNDHSAVTVNSEFSTFNGGAGFHIFQGSGDVDVIMFWPNMLDVGGHYEIGTPIAPGATRAIDKLNFPLATSLTELTAYISVTPINSALGASAQNMIEIHDGTNNNRIFLWSSVAALSEFLQIRAGGATVASVGNNDGRTRGTKVVYAFAVGTDDARLFRDGVLVGTDSDMAFPTGLDTLSIGGDAFGGSPASAVLVDVHLCNKAQDDALIATNSTELAAM